MQPRKAECGFSGAFDIVGNMNIPTKKLKSGFELPVYGLGMWQMGGRAEADYANDEADIRAIDGALKAGVTHVDVAESYGNGHAEELLSKVLPYHEREKLIIASKVSAWNQSYEGVMQAFERSSERLGTPYLDLYLLHFYPDSGIDIKDTMRAMDELVRQGVVKNIGVCNMTTSRFDEIQSHTSNKIVCNQVHYNVQYREVEDKQILKHAQDNDVMLVAWRPLQKGLLPSSKLINELAVKYGKTTAQISINWLTSQQNVVTIAKTSNANHLQENIAALNFVMETADVERIRTEYSDIKLVSDAVPLS